MTERIIRALIAIWFALAVLGCLLKVVLPVVEWFCDAKDDFHRRWLNSPPDRD